MNQQDILNSNQQNQSVNQSSQHLIINQQPPNEPQSNQNLSKQELENIINDSSSYDVYETQKLGKDQNKLFNLNQSYQKQNQKLDNSSDIPDPEGTIYNLQNSKDISKNNNILQTPVLQNLEPEYKPNRSQKSISMQNNNRQSNSNLGGNSTQQLNHPFPSLDNNNTNLISNINNRSRFKSSQLNNNEIKVLKENIEQLQRQRKKTTQNLIYNSGFPSPAINYTPLKKYNIQSTTKKNSNQNQMNINSKQLIGNNNNISINNNNNSTNAFFKFILKQQQVRSLCKFMLGQTSRRKFQGLNKMHFQLIQDLSYFTKKNFQGGNSNSSNDIHMQYSLNENNNNNVDSKYQSQSNLKQKCSFMSVVVKIVNWVNDLNNEGYKIIIWDIFMWFFSVFYFVMAPLIICFQDNLLNYDQIGYLVTNYVLLALFIVDIFLKLLGQNSEEDYDNFLLHQNQHHHHNYHNNQQQKHDYEQSQNHNITTTSEIYKFMQIKQKIIQYVKNYLIFDILPLIPILIGKYLWPLWFLGVFRFHHIKMLQDKIINYFSLIEKQSIAVVLLKLLELIVLVSHYAACTFLVIGLYASDELENKGNWLQQKNIEDAPWAVQYLEAYYFSVITMITVGYGDVTPISSIEKIYAIFMAIVSCGIFGYSVQTIGSIFQEQQMKNAQLKKKRYDVLQYLAERDISKQLQLRVLKQLELDFKKKEQSQQSGQIVLAKLSKQLQGDVLKQHFGQTLKSQRIFHGVYSDKFLNDLITCMQEKVLGQNESLFEQGQKDNRLYIITKGSIQLYVQRQEDLDNNNENMHQEKESNNNYNAHNITADLPYLQLNKNKSYYQQQDISTQYTMKTQYKSFKKVYKNYIGVLEKGKYFNQNSFFFNQKTEYSAFSVGITNLAYINQNDFFHLLRKYPRDYEIFCSYKDDYLLKNQYIKDYCPLCNKNVHQIQNCDKVFYLPNKYLTYTKSNFSQKQVERRKRQEVFKKYNIQQTPLKVNDSVLSVDGNEESQQQIVDLRDRQRRNYINCYLDNQLVKMRLKEIRLDLLPEQIIDQVLEQFSQYSLNDSSDKVFFTQTPQIKFTVDGQYINVQDLDDLDLNDHYHIAQYYYQFINRQNLYNMQFHMQQNNNNNNNQQQFTSYNNNNNNNQQIKGSNINFNDQDFGILQSNQDYQQINNNLNSTSNIKSKLDSNQYAFQKNYNSESFSKNVLYQQFNTNSNSFNNFQQSDYNNKNQQYQNQNSSQSRKNTGSFQQFQMLSSQQMMQINNTQQQNSNIMNSINPSQSKIQNSNLSISVNKKNPSHLMNHNFQSQQEIRSKRSNSTHSLNYIRSQASNPNGSILNIPSHNNLHNLNNNQNSNLQNYAPNSGYNMQLNYFDQVQSNQQLAKVSEQEEDKLFQNQQQQSSQNIQQQQQQMRQGKSYSYGNTNSSKEFSPSNNQIKHIPQPIKLQRRSSKQQLSVIYNNSGNNMSLSNDTSIRKNSYDSSYRNKLSKDNISSSHKDSGNISINNVRKMKPRKKSFMTKYQEKKASVVNIQQNNSLLYTPSQISSLNNCSDLTLQTLDLFQNKKFSQDTKRNQLLRRQSTHFNQNNPTTYYQQMHQQQQSNNNQSQHNQNQQNNVLKDVNMVNYRVGMFWFQFEKQQDFKFYKPHNNLSKILKKLHGKYQFSSNNNIVNINGNVYSPQQRRKRDTKTSINNLTQQLIAEKRNSNSINQFSSNNQLKNSIKIQKVQQNSVIKEQSSENLMQNTVTNNNNLNLNNLNIQSSQQQIDALTPSKRQPTNEKVGGQWETPRMNSKNGNNLVVKQQSDENRIESYQSSFQLDNMQQQQNY